MDQELQKKIEEQSIKIDAIYKSVEKTRKYFLMIYSARIRPSEKVLSALLPRWSLIRPICRNWKKRSIHLSGPIKNTSIKKFHLSMYWEG